MQWISQVWTSLYVELENSFTCFVEYKPVKQEVSRMNSLTKPTK